LLGEPEYSITAKCHKDLMPVGDRGWLHQTSV
jgi:hypothetical protein